VAITAVEEL
jgi:hypothetical protein